MGQALCFHKHGRQFVRLKDSRHPPHNQKRHGDPTPCFLVGQAFANPDSDHRVRVPSPSVRHVDNTNNTMTGE